MGKEIILIIFLIIGLIGTILPFLPGTGLMFFALLVYGFFDKWTAFSPLFVLGVGFLTLLSILLDYFSGVVGARKFGATKSGIWGGLIGSFLGVLFGGPLGLIWGVIIGVILGEIVSGKDIERAFKTSLGTIIGMAGGVIAQFIIALLIFVGVILKIFF
ncbi:MAG: DUF456 domain-containing protein [Clostridia bacterium]|nr:DUF456 domain-containing protein [Clostridia bacterium]